MSIMSRVNVVKLQMCYFLLFNFISFYACTLLSIYLKKINAHRINHFITLKKGINDVKLT